MSSGKHSKLAEIHFVVSTGTEKVDPELRKFIRSHVMQGKNKGKKLPPRVRKPKVASAVSVTSADDAESRRQQRPNGFQLYDIQVVLQRNRFSPATCFPYADKLVEPRSVEVVFQFSTIAKAILFPLEPCIFFESRAEHWVGPLGMDPAFLHAMIYSAQTFFDSQASPTGGVVISSPSKKALPHLIKTIELLRERFGDGADEEARKSLTTVSTITSLAALAHAAGDEASARNHLQGLYKIVELRGGLDTFQGSEKLFVEVLRCDIGIALFHGSKTLFFAKDGDHPQPPNLNGLVPLKGMSNNKVPSCIKNKELAGIWKTLRDFSALANYAAAANKLFSMRIYANFMNSTIYPLMKMDFGDSVDEVIRLALLAYSASVFLQWKKMTHCKAGPYPYLAELLRNALRRMGDEIEPDLRLWLIMVGSVAVLDVSGEDEEWIGDTIREHMALCGLPEWGELRRMMEGIMWVGLVHDGLARQVMQGVARRIWTAGCNETLL
ncbi:hypothetical protein QBC38DRAFT_399859 [Podospora fimiseda]|uniref:Uncharacterized protein n=1 Tax=Podospora fimiseda TaxID=252190 RepID=A0AAN7BHF8_9PEZI|nr:hypothetical protein QBC38DRAFT_399859 [Podospora fimiseda]